MGRLLEELRGLRVKDLLIAYPAAALVLFLFYRSPWVLFPALPAVFPCARMLQQERQEAERRKLLYQFRDLLFSLFGSFATGRQMTEALREAEANLSLIYGETEPIRRELALMLRQLREQQSREEDVWEDFGERSGLEDVADFAEMFRICRQSGGDLERVIHRGASVLMDKISIYREIQSLTVQKRWESRVLVCIPLLVLALLQFTAPDYMSVMYGTLPGRLLMSLAFAAITGAYLWCRRINRMEV